jgi:L-fuconolactonase
MLKIDAHQHFWVYNPVKDAWITDDMQVIQRDFLPGDLLPVLQQHNIAGCVAVQADQSEIENDFLLGIAETNPFIKGIVGWVDLRADNIEDRLQHYHGIKLIKGFRHILPGEPDERFMLDKKFMHGIGLLNQYGFTYDILIHPPHLPYAVELAAAFPYQRFVIDHIAKPYIKGRQVDGWRQGIEAVAVYPNVHCKISGMVTEAEWSNWIPHDFEPYMDAVFNAFGANRVMFGSDWPVCNLAGGFSGALKAISEYILQLSEYEQELFWGKNAIEFYRLDASSVNRFR